MKKMKISDLVKNAFQPIKLKVYDSYLLKVILQINSRWKLFEIDLPQKKKDTAKAQMVDKIVKLKKCSLKHGKSSSPGFGKHHCRKHSVQKHFGHFNCASTPKFGHRHHRGHFDQGPKHQNMLESNLPGERGCDNFLRPVHNGPKSFENGSTHQPRNGHGCKRRRSRSRSRSRCDNHEHKIFPRSDHYNIQALEVVDIDGNSDLEIVFQDVGSHHFYLLRDT